MPLYLSVHRNRAGQHREVAQLMIVAAELSRWTATQGIEIEIKASGLAADSHDYMAQCLRSCPQGQSSKPRQSLGSNTCRIAGTMTRSAGRSGLVERQQG